MQSAPLSTPQGGRHRTLTVRPPELEVLDNWLGDRPEPKPGRSESIRLELHDWLTGLSLLPHSHDREDRH